MLFSPHLFFSPYIIHYLQINYSMRICRLRNSRYCSQTSLMRALRATTRFIKLLAKESILRIVGQTRFPHEFPLGNNFPYVLMSCLSTLSFLQRTHRIQCYMHKYMCVLLYTCSVPIRFFFSRRSPIRFRGVSYSLHERNPFHGQSTSPLVFFIVIWCVSWHFLVSKW